MSLCRGIASFFRTDELSARRFLSDAEMATWVFDNIQRISFGDAW